MYLTWKGDGTCTWQGTATWQRESPHGMHPSDSRDAVCITDTPNWLQWVSRNLRDKIAEFTWGYKLQRLTRKDSSTLSPTTQIRTLVCSNTSVLYKQAPRA